MFSHRVKDTDHIVRYCKPRYYDKSKREIISYEAFKLREGEKYLSCFWKEYYKNNPLERIYEEALNNNLTPSKEGGFSVLLVEKIKKTGKRHELFSIKIKHKGFMRSYSGIYNTTNEYKFLRDMLLVATENYNVVDLHK